jgi:hypothetical protein
MYHHNLIEMRRCLVNLMRLPLLIEHHLIFSSRLIYRRLNRIQLCDQMLLSGYSHIDCLRLGLQALQFQCLDLLLSHHHAHRTVVLGLGLRCWESSEEPIFVVNLN